MLATCRTTCQRHGCPDKHMSVIWTLFLTFWNLTFPAEPTWWYCSIQCSIILPIPRGMSCIWFATCIYMLCIFGMMLIPIQQVCAIALSIRSCGWLQWASSGSFTWMPANAPSHSFNLIPTLSHIYWPYSTASLSLTQQAPLLSHEIQTSFSYHQCHYCGITCWTLALKLASEIVQSVSTLPLKY